jgi:hypothetical protein
MASLRKTLGLVVLGAILAMVAGPALAQSFVPVTPADQGTTYAPVTEHDSNSQ